MLGTAKHFRFITQPGVHWKWYCRKFRQGKRALIVTSEKVLWKKDGRKKKGINLTRFYALCRSSGTCGRTNESLTFPVNCGFMVYRRTAETFYCSAMRDNAVLTAECPDQNESSEYTRDAYAGNVFPCVLFFAAVPGISDIASGVGRKETNVPGEFALHPQKQEDVSADSVPARSLSWHSY